MEILKYFNDRIVDSPHVFLKRNVAEALLGAGGSILGSVLGFLSNENTNDLNDLINQRNLSAAEKMLKSQQDYNTYMMQNQKQMQMEDAKQSGVNPAFAQGSSIGNQSPSPSGSVPSALPMRSYDWSNVAAIGNNINEYLLQKKVVDAQAENLYADTYKKLAETDRQRIENKYLPSLLRGQVNMLESNIDVNGSIKFKNEWEAKNFAQNILESNQRIEKIGEEIKQIQQSVQNMEVDRRIKLIEEFWKSDECKATIDNLRASASLSRQQAQDIVATQASRIMLLDTQATESMYKSLNISADTQNLRDTNRLIHISGDHMQFNLNSDQKYRNKERALGLVKGATEATHNITSAIGDLMGTLNPLSNVAKTAKSLNDVPNSNGYIMTPSR